MPFPSSEADRLNHYLDARVQGRQVNPDDLDPSLVDAYERVKAMDARSAPDPQLMTNLWRTMMSTIPAEMGYGPRAVSPALPLSSRRIHRGHRTTIGGLVTALGVVALLLASAIGYQRFNSGSDPGQPTTIPAAFQQAGTPTATGCEALPREPGSIAEIVETPQTLHPYLPRFGQDPVYGESQDRQNANGQFLIDNSTQDATLTIEIEQALEELVDCRFYTVDNLGRVDMEGRYFALYSDDFIRRELSGYQEAGRPLVLTSWWAPNTVPEIVEIRRLTGLDGPGAANRVLAILNTEFNEPGGALVVVFREQGDRWLVDEVGFAEVPQSPSSPTASTPVPGQWADRFPLQLDIAIRDADPAGTPAGMSGGLDPTECGPLDQGTPVPCGIGFNQSGPYPYTVFPANTDFTITLYNLGEQPKRFVIADLGIEVELEPGGSESIVLNAETGDYLFTIFQGDQPDPISAGVVSFIPPEGPPPGMG